MLRQRFASVVRMRAITFFGDRRDVIFHVHVVLFRLDGISLVSFRRTYCKNSKKIYIDDSIYDTSPVTTGTSVTKSLYSMSQDAPSPPQPS
jgi:hypothetical protein